MFGLRSRIRFGQRVDHLARVGDRWHVTCNGTDERVRPGGGRHRQIQIPRHTRGARHRHIHRLGRRHLHVRLPGRETLCRQACSGGGVRGQRTGDRHGTRTTRCCACGGDPAATTVCPSEIRRGSPVRSQDIHAIRNPGERDAPTRRDRSPAQGDRGGGQRESANSTAHRRRIPLCSPQGLPSTRATCRWWPKAESRCGRGWSRSAARQVSFADGHTEEFDGIVFGTGFDAGSAVSRATTSARLSTSTRCIWTPTATRSIQTCRGWRSSACGISPADTLCRWNFRPAGSRTRGAARYPRPTRPRQRDAIADYRARRGSSQKTRMNLAALTFARAAGVEPQLENWPDLKQSTAVRSARTELFPARGPRCAARRAGAVRARRRRFRCDHVERVDRAGTPLLVAGGVTVGAMR